MKKPACLGARVPLFVIALLLQVHFASAQADSTRDKKQGGGKLSLSYLSNSVYYGRKDSLTLPYFTATARYDAKGGFYISGSLAYLAAANEHRIDLASIDAGYSFNISDKFNGEVYGEKSWYNSSSANVKSDIKGSIGGQLSYDASVIQISAGSDITFAGKTDIGFNLGLSHGFYSGNINGRFSAEPAITAYWSTLHSYEGYINRKLRRKNQPGGGAVSAVTTVQDNKMTLLNYELSVPLAYETKSWGIACTPYYSIAQHPITTTTVLTTRQSNGQVNTVTVNSTPASELNLSNTFYVELELYLRLR